MEFEKERRQLLQLAEDIADFSTILLEEFGKEKRQLLQLAEFFARYSKSSAKSLHNPMGE
jgi:hypothetical protein